MIKRDIRDKDFFKTPGYIKSSSINPSELILSKISDKKELFLEPIKGSDFSYTNWPELSLSAKKVQFSRNDTVGFAIRLQSIQDLRMSMSFSISEPVDIPVTRKLQNYEASEAEKQFLILPLTHRACQDAEIAGGKGSNLAKLMSLQATVRKIVGGLTQPSFRTINCS
uniref:Uncharacterized protein n=1 Tax=Panagrolaimus superbus TaxID=310955 RepID=A0A914YP19_9BILA